MSDEKLKEEIKQVVTNLGNIKFTVEDELEFCKQVLERKEQECERLKYKLERIRQIEELALDEILTVGRKNATAQILQIIEE